MPRDSRERSTHEDTCVDSVVSAKRETRSRRFFSNHIMSPVCARVCIRVNGTVTLCFLGTKLFPMHNLQLRLHPALHPAVPRTAVLSLFYKSNSEEGKPCAPVNKDVKP